MVVQSPASRVLTLLSRRHTAHVAPVVIAQQDEHIVRNTHTLVVIVKHLLIQRPHLGSLLGGPTRHVLDNPPLVLDNALQQLRVGILAHGLVAVAAHADGHNVVSTLHTLNALTEETV